METLLVSYAVAWTAVSVYVAWLALENRRLAQRLARLEDALRERHAPTVSRAKVA